MNQKIFTITSLIIVAVLLGCSKQIFNLTDSKLNVLNREISSIDKATNTISLNNAEGEGLAILEDIEFDVGTIQLDLKGENSPGRSFVGLAFNIQNDSTFEAIYFRPFNFQSKEKIRREHSVQYINHPKYNWRYLRTNYEGKYEAEYKRQPSPDDWFSIKITVDNEMVSVYDRDSDIQLLSIKRLDQSKSKKVGLWVGNNSKGEFRNLQIKK